MQNLAHSASFESLDKDAPSKAGTKQLAKRNLLSRRVAERRTATPPVGPRASLAAIPHELHFAGGHRSDKKANFARCVGGFLIVIKGGTIGAVGLSGGHHSQDIKCA